MPPEMQEHAEPSLRDALESAFDDNDRNDEARRPAENAEESVRSAEKEGSVAEAVRAEGRDGKGRFAPKRAAAPDAGDAPRQRELDLKGQPAEQQPAPIDQFAKPPQSWKRGAREAWASLPPDVRAEVHRRERESQGLLQQTTQTRQLAQHVEQLQQRHNTSDSSCGIREFTHRESRELRRCQAHYSAFSPHYEPAVNT